MPSIDTPNSAPHNNYTDLEAGLPPRAHIYDYLIILGKYKWKITAFVLIGTILVAAYVFIMPQTYTAGAILLPPDKGQDMSLTSLLQSGSGFDLNSLSGGNASAEIFVAMLNSRTLADSLIERFDLLKRFGIDSLHRENAINQIHSSLFADADKKGVLTLFYNAQTGYFSTAEEQIEVAQFSSNIVNASIEILDHINREKLITRARRSREFLEVMKGKKRSELDSAQERFMEFQQKNKALALDKQLEVSVGALAEAQAQIQLIEMELAALRPELNDEAAAYRTLEAQLAELRSQKEGMEGEDPFGMNLQNAPELIKQYANLKLDLEVSTQVYTFLEAQYNQEQVQEARDLPTISVLDEAVPPILKSSPKRGIILILTIIGLFLIAVFAAFISHAFRHQLANANTEKFAELKQSLALRKSSTSDTTTP